MSQRRKYGVTRDELARECQWLAYGRNSAGEHLVSDRTLTLSRPQLWTRAFDAMSREGIRFEGRNIGCQVVALVGVLERHLDFETGEANAPHRYLQTLLQLKGTDPVPKLLAALEQAGWLEVQWGRRGTGHPTRVRARFPDDDPRLTDSRSTGVTDSRSTGVYEGSRLPLRSNRLPSKSTQTPAVEHSDSCSTGMKNLNLNKEEAGDVAPPEGGDAPANPKTPEQQLQELLAWNEQRRRA